MSRVSHLAQHLNLKSRENAGTSISGNNLDAPADAGDNVDDDVNEEEDFGGLMVCDALGNMNCAGLSACPGKTIFIAVCVEGFDAEGEEEEGQEREDTPRGADD